MMVSALLKDGDPADDDIEHLVGGGGRGGGRDGDGVRIIGGDPADDDVEHLGEEGEGGGAVTVSASSEETDPADELLHLQCVPGQLCDSSALPCAPIPPTHTHASCPPALVPAVRPWAAL